MAAQPPSLPPVIFGAFSGPINTETTRSLISNLSGATTGAVQQVHLMFHSTGGAVGDGVALYNFFKTFPIDLTLYNPGVVASIGAIAYLGALHRKTSPHAIFMIHRTQCVVQAGSTAQETQLIVNAARIDDIRTEAILRNSIKLPDEKWASFDNNDLHFTAKEAVEYRIADEIADFSPPVGARIWTF